MPGPSSAGRPAYSSPRRSLSSSRTSGSARLAESRTRHRRAVASLPASPPATYDLGDEVEDGQAEEQQDAGDGGRGPRVVDREPDQAQDSEVLGDAGADVGDRLRRGVDRQPGAGLDQVREQGGAAPDHARDGLVQRGRLACEQYADDRTGGRPDRGGDSVT